MTFTINGKSITITLGTTSASTTANVALAVEQVWNGAANTLDYTTTALGSAVPEFAEATATLVSSTVTLLADTAGYPFTLTTSKTSTSGTLTHATPTAATGPNFWTDANNWSTNAVPVTGDTVYIDNLAVDIKYGLNQSAVTLAALYVAQSFTATIGLPERNTNGTEYEEYRGQYLQIGATILQVGAGAGTGSGRIKIDCGSVATTFTLYASGSALDANIPAVLWKGTNAGNAVVQTDGDLGVGVYGTEAATIATLTTSGGQVQCGPGVTLSGALTVNAGTATFNTAVATSLLQLSGSTTINGTGAVAGLTLRGGTCVYNTSGALGGTPVVSGTGFLDFSQNPVPKTVSGTISVNGNGAGGSDVNKVVAALVVKFVEGADPSQWQFGANSVLTRS